MLIGGLEGDAVDIVIATSEGDSFFKAQARPEADRGTDEASE